MAELRLFHVTTAAAWERAHKEGTYQAPSLSSEGFIHLSTEAQLPGALERFYSGQSDLVMLEIDPTDLPIRYEAASDGAGVFPHLYGTLPLLAVLQARPL